MWGESLSTGSLTRSPGGRSKYVDVTIHPIGNGLTRDVSKLMYSMLTDAEAAFLGFGNACASAGRDGCKLLTLLHKDATGKEVKRLIEDSHDVSSQSGSHSSFTHLKYGPDTQLALKILLKKPAKAVVDPRPMRRESAFITHSSYILTRVLMDTIFSHDDFDLILPRDLEVCN